MKYTVIWQRKALDKLAAIWNDAADRAAITSAADKIDAELRVRPADLGESREDTSRILIARPLGILFNVTEADRLVSVWSVWLTGRK